MTKSNIADNTNIEFKYWGSNKKSLKQRFEAIEPIVLALAEADSGV